MPCCVAGMVNCGGCKILFREVISEAAVRLRQHIIYTKVDEHAESRNS